MATTAEFEAHLAEFCKLNSISMSDPFLWSDILSYCLLSAYMPAEFIWANRLRPWNWEAIKQRYSLGAAMSVYRGKSWTWRQFLAYHSHT
jgi:hypothetical protein